MSWTVSDDFPKMPGLLKTIKCLKGPHKSMDYNYPDEIPFKNQVGRVCISFENFILNSLSLICIIDQMFMVHISQGRYLSGFAMSSNFMEFKNYVFKNCLKTWYGKN